MLAVVLRGTLLFSILIALIACVGLAQQPSVADDEFNENLQRWRMAAIADYDLRYQQQCYCLPEHQRPVYLQVRSGEVVNAVYADNKQPLDPNIEYDLRPMVDWFELIKEAMAFPAAKLVVSYDESLGYPTSIYIDYHARMADDEVTISEISLVKVDKL